MTPMTIARPTIVRTRPPDVVPAFSVALALVSERLSGVDSPSAANVAGARRSRPSTATPADLRAGEICITEEGRVWIRTRPLHRPRFVHLEYRYPVDVLPVRAAAVSRRRGGARRGGRRRRTRPPKPPARPPRSR